VVGLVGARWPHPGNLGAKDIQIEGVLGRLLSFFPYPPSLSEKTDPPLEERKEGPPLVPASEPTSAHPLVSPERRLPSLSRRLGAKL